MEHVMLDIETMGIGPDAAIVSIGACKFDRDVDESLWETFYEVPSDWKGSLDVNTVKWWLSQPDETRSSIAKSFSNKPLKQILEELVEFIGTCSVWGNGVDFDNAIIQSACRREGVKPWSYRQNRCFRTIKNIYDSKTYYKPEIPHHAMYDAIAQAKSLIMLSNLYGVPLLILKKCMIMIFLNLCLSMMNVTILNITL